MQTSASSTASVCGTHQQTGHSANVLLTGLIPEPVTNHVYCNEVRQAHKDLLVQLGQPARLHLVIYFLDVEAPCLNRCRCKETVAVELQSGCLGKIFDSTHKMAVSCLLGRGVGKTDAAPPPSAIDFISRCWNACSLGLSWLDTRFFREPSRYPVVASKMPAPKAGRGCCGDPVGKPVDEPFV